MGSTWVPRVRVQIAITSINAYGGAHMRARPVPFNDTLSRYYFGPGAYIALLIIIPSHC